MTIFFVQSSTSFLGRFAQSKSTTSPLRRAPTTPRCCFADIPTSKGGDDGPLRYMPKVVPDDPIVSAVKDLPTGGVVTYMELLDTRWNGNEAMRIDIDSGDDKNPRHLFAKINRVEDPSVFMSEAMSLTAMLNATSIVRAPKPLHVGTLPRVGAYGPGAFMLLEWFDLAPFGAQRKGAQRKLAEMLAELHTSPKCVDVHQGRFGFPTSNYLALSPMDNTWGNSWTVFFARRLAKQVGDCFRDKTYGRAPLSIDEDGQLKEIALRIVRGMDMFFENIEVAPSLLHGDLWIGNVGATKNDEPVIFDPACFYGHSEFDLALPRMFGGYNAEFWDSYFEKVPKQPGFDERAKVYELYQYLNQLNLFGDPAVKRKVYTLAEEIAKMMPKCAST